MAMLRTLIELTPGLTLVGEARNGLEAIEVARQTRPDLILLDVMMPVMDGIAALAHLRLEVPEAKVVYLTALAPRNFDNPPWEHGGKPDAVIPKTWLPSRAMAEIRKLMDP